MENKHTTGHLSALLTIIIWGTTFISTKILLADFQPVEILFFRFIIGLFALLTVCPRRLKGTTRRQELTFVAAGLCGICLYYLLENIALTYTLASNVGVIISVAPFFTAILSHLVMKEEKLRANFFLGFVVAMTGIFLISFNGSRLALILSSPKLFGRLGVSPVRCTIRTFSEPLWTFMSLTMIEIVMGIFYFDNSFYIRIQSFFTPFAVLFLPGFIERVNKKWRFWLYLGSNAIFISITSVRLLLLDSGVVPYRFFWQ